MTNYIGEIKAFAGNFAPVGWALCNGSTLAISEYEALYTLLGTTYGGDGITTFGLPNLQGNLIVGTGQLTGGSNYLLGQTGGVTDVTITSPSMPSHSHAMYGSTADATTGDPTNANLAASNGTGYSDVKIYIPLPPESPQPNATLNPATITYAGGSQPHTNLMPYVCITYIIATYGIFPSQG